MQKLPISIGILSWHSGQVLVDTLTTYYENGLFDMVNDVTILFQEVTPQDMEIARHFGLDFIGLQKNIGIGQAFIRLTENAQTDYVLVLEHDWNLIEDKETIYKTLSQSISAIEIGLDVVRLRHRINPGNPHFSFRYKGKELTYYDDEIGCTSPHLLDSIHWCEADIEFPEQIQKIGNMFYTTSRYGNWTNNPCLYKKQFYLDTVKPFAGEGIALEGNISKWWAQQEYKVGHNEGLFMHNDWQKYGK
jgi:PHD/YefM family antitoxin component YafN of YafNO toxin-antitoxin module